MACATVWRLFSGRARRESPARWTFFSAPSGCAEATGEVFNFSWGRFPFKCEPNVLSLAYFQIIFQRQDLLRWVMGELSKSVIGSKRAAPFAKLFIIFTSSLSKIIPCSKLEAQIGRLPSCSQTPGHHLQCKWACPDHAFSQNGRQNTVFCECRLWRGCLPAGWYVPSKEGRRHWTLFPIYLARRYLEDIWKDFILLVYKRFHQAVLSFWLQTEVGGAGIWKLSLAFLRFDLFRFTV